MATDGYDAEPSACQANVRTKSRRVYLVATSAITARPTCNLFFLVNFFGLLVGVEPWRGVRLYCGARDLMNV